MASKVLVKIPVTPFGHVNKGKTNDVGPEIVAVGRTVEVDGIGTSKSTDPLLRIAQLEQNIRFLQEQHQQMLTGLHQEIDSLRQRNRDLQFQLVFSKGSIVSSSSTSPSSPEDESKPRVLSPKQVNVTPLQVELLERELGELKLTLQEVNTRNVYLTAIVDEQKKKLERHDKEKDQTTQPDPELLSKLDDVESLVRKLRRENDDLRREVTEMRSGNNSGNHRDGNHRDGNHRDGNHRDGNHRDGNHRGGRHRGNHYRGHRFPPLHTQSYWQGGRGGGDRDGEGGSSGTSLPSLNMNQQNLQGPQNHQGQPPHTQGQPHPQGQHYSGRRTSNNNHQYHQGGGENRKYRGGHSRGPKS